ncbi:Suppressor of Sensor Kinase (SLN1) [Trebouxia sp. C0009 RCD-2024]
MYSECGDWVQEPQVAAPVEQEPHARLGQHQRGVAPEQLMLQTDPQEPVVVHQKVVEADIAPADAQAGSAVSVASQTEEVQQVDKQAEDLDSSFQAISPPDQEAYVPSLPWWDPASADDLYGCAVCVACQEELEEPVVHKQAANCSIPHITPGHACTPAHQEVQGCVEGDKAQDAQSSERRDEHLQKQATEAPLKQESQAKDAEELADLRRKVDDLASQLKQTNFDAVKTLQAQQEEPRQSQQRCKDAEAGNAALANEQQVAAKRATSQLEVSARLQKQLEEAETRAALHIAQLEQAARDAEARVAALVSEQQEAERRATSQLKAKDAELAELQARLTHATADAAVTWQMDKQVVRSPAVNWPVSGVLGGASEGYSPQSPFRHGDTRAKATPLVTTIPVQQAISHMSRSSCGETLGEALQRADNDLAAQLAVDLAEAQAASQKLQERCVQLEADMADLQARSQVPCMPWGPQWQPRQELGRGSNGVVFGTVNSDFPGTVLKRGRALNLRHEADTLWSLHHPNIVRAHALITCQEKDEDDLELGYLALDWQGPSLASFLATHPRPALTTRQVVVGFQGLAAGVAYMHKKGLVDQDLHPGNILLSSDHSALVKADLGNAVPKEMEGRPNWLGRIMCCVGTESPQVAKAYLVDAQYKPLFSSDVWALGLVMLEVVGGRKPQQHLDVLSRQDYLEEVDGEWVDPYDPDEAPGKHRHLTYLRDLLTEPGKPDYADQGEDVSAQVTFPPWLQGPPDSPEAQLQGVIRACLRVRLKDRWPSDVVHLTLHAMMLQYGWSSGMMDT